MNTISFTPNTTATATTHDNGQGASREQGQQSSFPQYGGESLDPAALYNEHHQLDHQMQDSASMDRVGLSQHGGTTRQKNSEGIALESVTLSHRVVRAQKIEQVAEAFFQNPQFSSADLPKLIQRLYQDELVNDYDLNQLSARGFELPVVEGTLLSFSQFIEQQRAILQQEKIPAAENSPSDNEQQNIKRAETQATAAGLNAVLLKLLDDAEQVLSGVDIGQHREIGQIAVQVSTQLGELLSGDIPLSVHHRQHWQGIKATMQLANVVIEPQPYANLTPYYSIAS